ncbi:hypothetical protein L7F22_044609 [Adiantum nelumboides]|nr:hypothetical protein [Adiantum nelumboides]
MSSNHDSHLPYAGSHGDLAEIGIKAIAAMENQPGRCRGDSSAWKRPRLCKAKTREKRSGPIACTGSNPVACTDHACSSASNLEEVLNLCQRMAEVHEAWTEGRPSGGAIYGGNNKRRFSLSQCAGAKAQVC